MKFSRLLKNLQAFDLEKYGDKEVVIQSLNDKLETDYHLVTFVGYTKTNPSYIVIGDERAAEKMIRKDEF